MPQPEPLKNAVYLQLIKNVYSSTSSEGFTRTSTLVETPEVGEITRYVSEDRIPKRSKIAEKYKKDSLKHTATSRINRQLAILEELNLIERPVKEGSLACVKIRWEGWGELLMEKYLEEIQKRPEDFVQNNKIPDFENTKLELKKYVGNGLSLWFENYFIENANNISEGKFTIDGIVEYAIAHFSVKDLSDKNNEQLKAIIIICKFITLTRLFPYNVNEEYLNFYAEYLSKHIK